MTRPGLVLALSVAAAGSVPAAERTSVTTSGAIAVANLDHQIAQRGDVDLLLARARFLGDDDALDRAAAAAEGAAGTAQGLLVRAVARSAVHRFADALADVDAAERAGARRDRTGAVRASILVATGRAAEVVPELECLEALRPGFASRSALAGAYAAEGRFEEADALYVAALGDLDTTSPFPYAWVHFARGVLWAEEAGDPARGEAAYRRALDYLPGFVAAGVHLAELEAARSDLASAVPRLERLVAASGEPEAEALLGRLHVRTGDPERGRAEIERARGRFERLLARHPLAFADHAAEFYLGPGADPARALALARQNLANRGTRRAAALVRRAEAAEARESP
jgi:tetratricopeptide (TPR) repeat protein